MSKATISFELNGEQVSVGVSPGRRFSRVLREDLGLTGTKVGCNAGDCGACTILVDSEAVCACMMPAQQATGHSIETVEGLAGGRSTCSGRLQQSFLRHGAAQCGICTPGMLVAAEALLRKIPRPDEQQVEDAIGGVLCRCTGYRKIVEAIVNANASQATDSPDAGTPVVGEPIVRLDGAPKVSGMDSFGGDAFPADALLARAVRSPYPRAGFSFGDIDAYVADSPGVIAVYTSADVPGKNCFGVIPEFVDQPVFAEEETRFEGEAVALVVGDADIVHDLDLSSFPVSWRKLPQVMTSADAADEDAPQLHPGRQNNRLTGGFVQTGDLDAGFDASDVVVEGTFTTGFIEHAYIEPEAGYARRVEDRIEVQACTQAPYMDRDGIAEILGIDKDRVRIIPTAVGGGFGSKLDLSLQPFLAIAAWQLRQPVKMVYSRTESMLSTTKRHPSHIHARIAANKDGKVTAMTVEGTFNTGAYASWGPTVANRVPIHACGPYHVENYRAESSAIHTHCPPSGAFRGFGVPQSAIAQETLFDLLAEDLGIDPLEFRIRNALANGLSTVTGQRFASGVGIGKCLEALRPYWQQAVRSAEVRNESEAHSPRRYGVGLAGLWYGCGNTSLPNPSTIRVGLKNDGRIVLFQGAVDIGQGSNTVIGQICADAIGLSIDQFDLVYGDTDLTADAGKTSASRQTFVSGKAAYLAGRALRDKLLTMAEVSQSAQLSLSGNTLVTTEGNIDRSIALDRLPADKDGFVARAEGTFDPPTVPLDENGQGEPYASFGYGAQMVELSVDTVLGTTTLEKFTAVHDVGKVINPVLAEGQVQGGIAQGIGLALMEEYAPGQTDNLHDYLIPTAGDVPDITTVFIEEQDAHGPYGAKGLGEHVLCGTAPAILNAIRHATGAVVRDMPATPERVLAAIRSTTDS